MSIGKVLVHCQMGISRSSTCALAYLMICRKMSAADAIRTVRLRRDVWPNEGFQQQLADLDNELKRERQYSFNYYSYFKLWFRSQLCFQLFCSLFIFSSLFFIIFCSFFFSIFETYFSLFNSLSFIIFLVRFCAIEKRAFSVLLFFWHN